MPSYQEVVTTITVIFLLAIASGHGDAVNKAVFNMRRQALTEAHKPWGCPSVFDRHACTGWKYGQK